MKWSLIVPAAVGLLLAGAGGGWWWANRMQGQPAMVEAKAAEVLYWYDPMVPQQHFDKPGKSPFMDMELVPRYAEDAGPATGVQIAAGVQQNLGVRLAKVELVALAPRIDAAGVLGFNERDVAVVQSRANGFVEKVWRLAPGDRVRAGDPLVELLVPEWAAAEQEWLVVRQSGDASLLRVAHERLRLLGIDAVEIQRLEASGTAQSQFIVRAPISGVVQSLDVRAGMTLAAGQTLLRINGLDSVWMEVAVPEALAGNIRVGDRAEVHLADQGAATVEGRVGALLPALNDATRTLRVRVELINRLGRLRPGQSAQVTLIAGSSLDGLAVPTEAVIRTGKRSLVMLAEQGGFRPVEVVLGQEVGDRTVITSGLTEGQEVVASGQFLLDSEASLRGLGMPAMEEGAVIASVIRWSVSNRFLVLLAALFLTAWGAWSVKTTPIDALPDLSDVQVIIRTSYPGQAPQIVENQVTYPLTTTMLSVPGAKTVRGYSFFGDSFVYVLFSDGTDPYWARSRVLEYLSAAQARLPAAARASLGPDATGVGWIFQYALIDRTGQHDLAELRSLQDWFLKFELKTLPDVAEVATIGGMVKQYQVVLDPVRLASRGITQADVSAAIGRANSEAGGAVLTLGEAELMVRASGYLKTLADFEAIPLKLVDGVPVLLRDVAHVQIGPEMRRGISELDGEGEAVGGVVILRSGKNARSTIAAVHAKLDQLKASLPKGVEIVPTYDRSGLIDRAVENLTHKLIEEFFVVALVCGLFLWHLRSSLVAVISLPLGVLIAFAAMRYQGINANIMSLGGIAIAIGAMVDAAVVMIENAHKKVEAWQHANPGRNLAGEPRWQLMTAAAIEVGPAVFFSLLIITVSFLPVLTLEAQEGRLFGPLALTKSYAMAAAAGLSVTLVPVLMGAVIRGRLPSESANPLNRLLVTVYRPLLEGVLRWPRATLAVAAALLLTTLWPLSQLGGEFLPPLDEGDLLYMPSALPGLSAQKAAELLQQTDRMIKTVPEVARVFGKAGRAETATDPAPLEMFETTIQFKPREQWRAGMTPRKLVEELDRAVQVPGLTNIWIPPLRNRIDMLATGIKSPIGIKIAGSDLGALDRVGVEVERIAKGVPGVSSALAERLTGGRYVDVDIDRQAAARYGLNIADVQSVVSGLVGGETVGESVEGLARYSISLRYPREWRDSVQRLQQLPFVTSSGAQITLGMVADIRVSDGPPMLKSENARPSAWVYVDVRGRDLASTVADLRTAISRNVTLSPGMSVSYSGQFEFLERANARLKLVVPATLLIIFVLLYMAFKRFDEALLIMATLPFALIGGVWFLYMMGYNLSVATGVGFIALAGVSAEFGVIMIVYLKHAWEARVATGLSTEAGLLESIREGAVLRVRPKAMTVAVIIAGLLPILLGSGTGSEIMSRIAAPMVGGMITAPLLSLFVVPAAYRLMRRRMCRSTFSSATHEVST